MTANKNAYGFTAILVLLIILGIAALVGVSYYFGVNKIGKSVNIPNPTSLPLPTASQSPTADQANWITYTNMSHNYSFSYPASYYLANDVDGFDGIVPSDAENISLGELINSKYIYENRLLSLSYLGLLTDISPVNQWQKTSVIIAGIKSSKFTKIDRSANFDYYHIPTIGTEGIELMVNNKQQLKVDQILFTFKFTNSLSEPPKPISDLFSAINTKFNINLISVEESEFYSTAGIITKKSWKIDFVNTNLGKSLTTFLNTQLTTNNLESAGGAGGGVDAYENNQIKCNHVYGYKSGDPTNWKDPFNYLSCAEK